MALATGTRLGRYEIRSPIGKGGMGEVYLARDTQLRRTIALKLLPSQFTTDENRLRRFQQEAYAASALNHPNILTIYEIGEVDSTHFIATEFVDGETLRQQMTHKRMNLGEVLEIAFQVASALAVAHAAGIIHRDIKPENLMLRRDSIVKVLDFGLAKLAEQQATASDAEDSTMPMINTEPGVVMGTVYYMSPEQVQGLEVDARTDIWSLSVMLYEMVTGHAPFAGATTSDVIAKVLEREPAPLSRSVPEVPAELERIASKGLTKDREERYQSAKDLLIDLRRLKRRLELDAELERSARPDANSRETAKRNENQAVTATARELKASAEERARPNTSAEYIASEIKRHKKGVAIALTIITVMVAGVTYFPLVLRNSKPPLTNESKVEPSVPDPDNSESSINPHKLYWQITQDEQTEFIKRQAEQISAMLGPRPPALNKEAVARIREQVDSYVARRDSLSSEVFKGGLRPLYSRASIYAPFIIQAFNERHVPPVIGLYIAMIESEYHPCYENQFGGEGLFGFAPQTALNYGVDPKGRCDPGKISRAAAHYMDDVVSEFGSDSASVTLAIISYNAGEGHVRNYLHTLLNNGIRERSYWALVANADKFDESFRDDPTRGRAPVRYVPRFFAAAIIGENPQAFDLQIQPLSSYTGGQ